MNILLINDYLEGGGAEAVFRGQFEILQKDHNVEMFYGYKYISERKLSSLSYIYSFHFKRELDLVLKNRSFDFIIIHNYNGILSPSVLDVLYNYKKRKNCKLLYYAHDFHLICPNRGYSYFQNGKRINFQQPPTFSTILLKRLDSKGIGYSILKKLQWILAYTIRKKQKVFDIILAPSDFLVNQIKMLYPDLRVERLYNSCNALGTIAKKIKKEKNNTLRLVYFGRLAEEKGLLDFINALKHSKVDYSFTMIGEGDQKDTLQDTIIQNQLQNKVHIKSKLNHDELFMELQNYDVFVLPSLWYENAPLSIVEAVSIGLGLFLSDHGGVLEIGKICHGSHFFNPFDKNDIVSKLEILYKEFLTDSLDRLDGKELEALFSKEIYIEHLQSYLVPNG